MQQSAFFLEGRTHDACGMQEPSLESLATPTDAAATEYTSQQKSAVALGVAAIGTYVGYTLVQSYKGETPQAIWCDITKSTGSAASVAAAPVIAFVNLQEEVRPLAREGLCGWLDFHHEVQLTFPTVMFVEEEETSTFADISSDVRRATLFAHRELHEAQDKQKPSPSSAQPQPQLCTVVYRTIIELEGQPLQDWEVDAPALRRWHGKAFTQRHSLGFTVDGRNVTVLTHDVEGILLTSRNVSTARSPPTMVAYHDTAALLRECGVPSTATFRQWWPSAVVHTNPSAAVSMMAFDVSSKKNDRVDALKSFVRTGRPASLWREPFSLFSMLGVVLRYNRPDSAVYPTLLLRTSVAATAPTAPRSLWAAMKGWPHHLSSLLLRRRDEGERGLEERLDLLSAPFLLLVKAAERSAVPSVATLKEVQTYAAQWVRHFAAVAPEHEAALLEVQRAEGGQWELRVDLTRTQCTVVAAAWLLTRVVGLVAAVGVSVVNVKLVAIPAVLANASLLYPTTGSKNALHYWKPCTPSPSRSAAVDMGVQCAPPPSATQHSGWIPIELRAEKKMGFIVAQHDFAAL